MVPFYEWLYNQLLSNDDLDLSDYDKDDFEDYEDVLGDDNLNMDADEIETQMHVYAEECRSRGEEPDFGMYEELLD